MHANSTPLHLDANPHLSTVNLSACLRNVPTLSFGQELVILSWLVVIIIIAAIIIDRMLRPPDPIQGTRTKSLRSSFLSLRRKLQIREPTISSASLSTGWHSSVLSQMSGTLVKIQLSTLSPNSSASTRTLVC
jgi:hypothetical protein